MILRWVWELYIAVDIYCTNPLVLNATGATAIPMFSWSDWLCWQKCNSPDFKNSRVQRLKEQHTLKEHFCLNIIHIKIWNSKHKLCMGKWFMNMMNSWRICNYELMQPHHMNIVLKNTRGMSFTYQLEYNVAVALMLWCSSAPGHEQNSHNIL